MGKFPLTVNDEKDWTFATVREALKSANSLPWCRYIWGHDVETFQRMCDRLEKLAEASKVRTGPQSEAIRPSPTRKLVDAGKKKQWIRRVNAMTAYQNGSPEDRALFKHRYQDLPVAARPDWLTDEMCFTNGLKQDKQDYPTFQLYLPNTVLRERRKKTKRAARTENKDEEVEPVPVRTQAAELLQGGQSPSAFSATSAQDLQQRNMQKKRGASMGSFNGSMTSKVARFAETTLESREGSRADNPILLEGDTPFGAVIKPDFDDTTVLFFRVQFHGGDLHLKYTRTTTELLDRDMHGSRHALSSPLCVTEAADVDSDNSALQLLVYQRDCDGNLVRLSGYSDVIAAMKMAYREWQSWLPNRGLVFFVLHKREHFALIPERYFSLLNWSADELDEKHAVVYLAKQRAR